MWFNKKTPEDSTPMYVLLGATRIVLGLIFLWAFFDKVFGLGFATKAGKAWVDGVSPTTGFLKFGSNPDGPFHALFVSMAGSPVVDWLFMLGLLFIGTTMLVGILVRLGGFSGALLVLLMWLALIPPANNPILDEHVVYLLLFLAFALTPSGHWIGLGDWWTKTKLVQRYPWLG
jgi:thiosulfate dehydrogenase [quinone] large subunit